MGKTKDSIAKSGFVPHEPEWNGMVEIWEHAIAGSDIREDIREAVGRMNEACHRMSEAIEETQHEVRQIITDEALKLELRATGLLVDWASGREKASNVVKACDACVAHYEAGIREIQGGESP